MSKVVMTYRDYVALPGDGKRYELYDGELVELTSPTLRHQRAIRHLVGILDRHVRAQNLGEVIPAPFDVILSETTVVQPDIVFVARDRARVLTDRGIEGAPTLAVEVLSPSTAGRDRGRKQALYARYGLPYLWLVDPGDESLEAYELGAGGYVLVGRRVGQASARLLPFPDLAFAPSDLWL
jgi:Uma2 family endonuclease